MVIVVQGDGIIRFNGTVSIGGGTKILLRGHSELIFGNNFYLSLESTLYCYKRIEFGNDCTVGWNVLIMDTDWHKTLDAFSEYPYPMTQPIYIGNHCWICNDVQILKGTVIPDNIIVAVKSLCNKKYDVPQNSMIAGIPAKLKKENIKYVR